jgi:hypothetical protein
LFLLFLFPHHAGPFCGWERGGEKNTKGNQRRLLQTPLSKAAGGCKLFDKSVIIGLWGVKGKKKKRNSSSGTVTEQIIA